MYKALSSLHSPCSRAGLGSLQQDRLVISSLAFPLRSKPAEVLQEQCPKPPDHPVWGGETTLSPCCRNEPALLNRHWFKRAGMGGREALPVCRGTPQGGKATGPSSESNWWKTQAHYCTKDLRAGNESWALLYLISKHHSKEGRHVQSHGHAFAEFWECPKELQHTQVLHLGLSYTQSLATACKTRTLPVMISKREG